MKEFDYADPASMTTRRFLEGTCLEALRCDRNRWQAHMTESLFTGVRRDLYRAIMKATDSSDPVQVLYEMNGSRGAGITELAAIMSGTVSGILTEEGVKFRLGKLVEMQHRMELKSAVTDMAGMVKDGADLTEIHARYAQIRELETIGGLLGVFAGAKRLDESVGEETKPPAIVRKVIYPMGITVLAGEGGLGKSWLAIDMALRICEMEFWLGLQCEESVRVGYVCLEMHSNAIRDRVRKLTGGKLQKSAQEKFFYTGQDVTGRAIDILEDKTRLALAAFVAEKELGLLIVDPLRNTHKVDENNSTEMGNVLRSFSSLGCAVLLLHHVTKSTGKTRGSSAIRDWCDVVLSLSERDDNLVLGWEKRPRFDAVTSDIPIEMVREGEKITVRRRD